MKHSKSRTNNKTNLNYHYYGNRIRNFLFGRRLGQKIAHSVWGKTGIIQSAQQEFNKELGNYSPDIFLTIEIDAGGKYNDKVDLFGSFQRDERTNEITGWGGAFKVDQVLNDLGAYDGLSDEQKQIDGNELPSEAIAALQGIKVQYLVYCSGKHPNKDKPVYNTFWKLLPATDEDDASEKVFDQIGEALSGDSYHREKLEYGRNYLDSQNSGDTSFNYGANTSNSPSTPESSGSSLDDDLPI